MQLSDKSIYKLLASGELVFIGLDVNHPFEKNEQVQPASIDLRLNNRIVTFKNGIESFDVANILSINDYLNVKYYDEHEKIIIPANGMVFGEIYEQISIGNTISARIEGRSRLARLGLSIHCTGDYINPGFVGSMPLQIINHNSFPVVLYPYLSICQMFFYQLTEEPLVKYSDRAHLPSNPYYNESHAGPSVLSINELDGIDEKSSIVKYKIDEIIKRYEKKLSLDNHSSESDYHAIIKNYITNIYNEGELTMGDSYNAQQVGIMGQNAGKNATVNQQYFNESFTTEDIEKLKQEISSLKEYIFNSDDMDEDDKAIQLGKIAELNSAIKENNHNKFFNALKKSGKFLLEIIKTVGCPVLQQYLLTKI